MIILDMDGVLAEFDVAACRVHGLPENTVPLRWDWYADFGISDEQFWDKIHALGDSFYGELVKPYPWVREVIDMVCDADDFVIMSSPSNHPAGYAGKKIWLDKYVPGLSPKQLIVGAQKHLLARPDRLLIDDGLHNIEAFESAGGQAFVFPQPWNQTPGLLYWVDRMEPLKYRLNKWKEDKNVERSTD